MWRTGVGMHLRPSVVSSNDQKVGQDIFEYRPDVGMHLRPLVVSSNDHKQFSRVQSLCALTFVFQSAKSLCFDFYFPECKVFVL